MPFFAKLFVEFAKLVTCPVLFVSGGSTGFHVPDEDERLAAFVHVDRATLEGAGHMMHWTRSQHACAAPRRVPLALTSTAEARRCGSCP